MANQKLPGGLQGMAQNLMNQARQIESQLPTLRVEGVAGGGAVKVVANGSGEILDITISKDVVDPNDVDMLQALVLTAVRDAVSKSTEVREEKLKAVIPPGFNIPGLA